MEETVQKPGRHCAFCLTFIPTNNIKLCGGCQRRAYCSKQCQADDWILGKNGQVHKNWCKLGCGEEDLDWEVASVPRKGLGIIAKRMIPKNYRIMVDPVRLESHPGIQDLLPLNGTTDEKIGLNGLDNGEGGTVMCLRLARANHDCNSNAEHFYEPTFKVKILYATRDIQKDQEICINYQSVFDISNERTPEIARLGLRTKWGIECRETCICRDEEIRKLVELGRHLDTSIVSCYMDGQISDSVDAVDELLKLHDCMNSACTSKLRTLYDGFQMAVTREETLHKAKDYIRQAYEIACAIGSPKSINALKYKAYLENPSSHPLFPTNNSASIDQILNALALS